MYIHFNLKCSYCKSNVHIILFAAQNNAGPGATVEIQFPAPPPPPGNKNLSKILQTLFFFCLK